MRYMHIYMLIVLFYSYGVREARMQAIYRHENRMESILCTVS